MIEKQDYHHNLDKVKALLQFEKDDLAKYQALPKALAFVIKRKQDNIKTLENFILEVVCYVSVLEANQQQTGDKSPNALHLYHYPKDEDTIKCLAITQALVQFKQFNRIN